MRKQPRLLLQLENNLLSPERADQLRVFVLGLKPKTCLVMADWPWVEARGLTPAAEQKILARLRADGFTFRQLETLRDSRLFSY